MSLRFLHAADLHLGSPPRGFGEIPPSLRETFLRSTMTAFSTLVSLAIREKCDAVLLAGDLYDTRDRSITARLHLKRELERLHAAGIPSFIVHGNHDPLTADAALLQLPSSCTVFGTSWSEVCVTDGHGRVRFRVQGQSYPKGEVLENLSTGYRRQGPEPTIALLHTNLGSDAGHAPYAPCSLEDLSNPGLDYWALGHVHTRAIHRLDGGGLAVYPGNPQGRHIQENGARGAVLVSIAEGHPSERHVDVQFHEADVVRWHELDVALEPTVDALVESVLAQVLALPGAATVRARAVRVRLLGAGPLHAQLGSAGAFEELEAGLRERLAAERVWLASLVDQSTDEVSLTSLVDGGGLVGEVARLARDQVPVSLQQALTAQADLDPVLKQLRQVGVSLDVSALWKDAASQAVAQLAKGEDP